MDRTPPNWRDNSINICLKVGNTYYGGALDLPTEDRLIEIFGDSPKTKMDFEKMIRDLIAEYKKIRSEIASPAVDRPETT